MREGIPKGMKAFLFEGTSGLSVTSAIFYFLFAEEDDDDLVGWWFEI